MTKIADFLSRKISIFQGWGVSQPISDTPDWTGTIEEYWEKNADALTLGVIRDMIDDLDGGHHHAIGGGGMGCFTIRYANELTKDKTLTNDEALDEGCEALESIVAGEW